jgi:hypothetical protein
MALGIISGTSKSKTMVKKTGRRCDCVIENGNEKKLNYGYFRTGY